MSERPSIGQTVRVKALQSSRRGEAGVVKAISGRGIVDVEMNDGVWQFPVSELAWKNLSVGCFHPLSCSRCDSKGEACGEHRPGDSGHDRCTGM